MFPLSSLVLALCLMKSIMSSTAALTRAPTRRPTKKQSAVQIACKFLKYASLQECQSAEAFQGYTSGPTIPTEIGVLTQLSYLDILTTNHLRGTIPSEIGKLTKLTAFHLSANHLTGTIPKQLANLKDLYALTIRYNEVRGSIPNSLCTKPVQPQIFIDCGEVKCNCCLGRFGTVCPKN